MSYCVKCGVELDDGVKKCPLCSTPVINPDSVSAEYSEAPFSDRVFIPKAINVRFRAYLVSMIMLIPNIICILSNILFDPKSNWSFYIAATTALVWTLFVLPFTIKKTKARPYLFWGIDSIAVSAYILFLFAVGGRMEWFLRCALPAIIAASFFSLIYILWYRSKPRSKISKALHLCADFIAGTAVIGCEISYYYQSVVPIHVAGIINASLFAVLMFLFACETNKRMRAWITRNFFVE